MLPSRIPYRSLDKRKQAARIIYNDQRLLVVDKPAGLPVIPDRWQKAPVNLRDLLQREISKYMQSTVHVVHRIDQDTSGLVVFALDPDTHRQLNGLFEENQVDKTYIAFCRGQAPQQGGVIDLPLQPSSGRTYKTVVARNGKPAKTTYRVIEQYREFCMLEIKPASGRPHQIRAHMQQIGLPLAVDPLYAGISQLGIFDIKRRRSGKSDDKLGTALINRLTLHACALSFVDPHSEKQLFWEAELPADMAAVHKALQKYGQPAASSDSLSFQLKDN